MSKLISICMATYNGEKYLKEQLDSIVKQTYKNIELVVQDDASSDNTLKIIKSYENKLDIKLIKNEKNQGYVKNFQLAMQRASGEYIALCDQDDIWKEDKLKLLLENINGSTLIYSDSLLVDESGKSTKTTLSKKLKNNFISSNSSLNFLYDNSVSAHALLFKKELLEHLKEFPKHLYFDQYIAATAANMNGVKYLDKTLVYYRQHTTNTLANKSKKTKSTKEKLKSKVQKKADANKKMLEIIKEFENISVLSKKDLDTLQRLKKFYTEFENIYYSVETFLLLFTHRNRFFKISKKNRFIQSIKRAIGLKLYRILPIL